MSGLEVPIILAATSAGTQVAGGLMGASAMAGAAERSAALKRLQADELDSRELVNEDLMRRSAESTSADYANAGGGVGGVLRMRTQLQENLTNARRDAGFKSYLLRQGAEQDLSLASDQVLASYVGGVGTVLGAGANTYGKYGNFNKTPSVGDAPNLNGSYSTGNGYSTPDIFGGHPSWAYGKP